VIKEDGFINPIRILHVDDEQGFISITKAFLKSMNDNIIIDSAISVGEALKKIELNSYNVIISDYQLPSTDGLQLLEILRSQGNKIPFIILTGKGREEVAIEALNLGADYYLQKKEDSDDFFTELNDYLVRAADASIEKQTIEEKISKLIYAVEQNPAMILISDTNGIIEYVNPKFTFVTGYEEEEVIGKNINFMRADKISDKKYMKMRENLFSGKKWKGVLLNQKKNGFLFLESATVSPIRSHNGEITHHIKLGEDITETKKAEEKIRKEREEITLYLDIITHDLNNHHSVAIGYLNILKDLLPVMPEETESKLNYAIGSITNASSLLNSISVLMRQRLSFNYDLQSIDVVFAINRVKKTIFQLYPNRKIKIRVIFDPNKTINVLADSLFDDLIFNLLTNAVKNDDHDLVNIDISIEQQDNSETSILTITDQGKGIVYQRRKGIFDRRFSTFRNKGKGSGLGLYIVKTLVDRYKGRIWIKDRLPGDYRHGTSFVIELFSA
jgi:PAS domain S-box-containing protein